MITIKNLLKRYENLSVVDNLNLTIEKNEVFGLVGSNGAGKTTTIHMLATLLKPTSGTAKLHSLLYAVPRDIREKRIAEVLNLGLDPSSRETMWEYIQRLVKEEKIAIILTTHYMEEADLLCDRIGIIDKGKIIALDSPLRLKESIGGDSIKIKVSPNSNLNTASLKQFNFIRKVEFANVGVITLSVDDATHNIPILLKCANNVESIEYSIPTLNDVFLQLTGRHIAKEEHSEGGFMERYAQYGK